MEILKLLCRIIIFAIGFYFLLECVLLSDVPTKYGVLMVIAALAVVILLFCIVGMKNRKVCTSCKHGI